MSSKYFKKKRAAYIPKDEIVRYYGPTSKSHEEAEIEAELW
jgi:hypothetical protein